MKKIILICLVLMAPTVLGQQPNSPETGQAHEASEEKPKGDKSNTSDLLPIVEQLEAIARNTAPDHDAGKNQEIREFKALDIAGDDLVQQEAMAKFTRLIYIVSAFGVAISTAGIILVGVTLWYTRKAAQSTADTMKIARDTLKQNRAWVVKKDQIKMDGHIAKDNHAEFETIWTNAGETPAIDVHIETRVIPVAQTEGKNIPVFKPSGVWDVVGVLGPGCTSKGYIALTNEDYGKLVIGVARVFIFTHIKYKTIYGDECLTETVEEISITHRTVYAIPGAETSLQTIQEGTTINAVGPQQRAT